MDVAINGTEGAEMGHFYQGKNLQWNILKDYIIMASLINLRPTHTQRTPGIVLFKAQK